MDPVFVKGVFALVMMLLVFVGSAWLLLTLILGVRMGYLVTACCFFGIMVILSGMWTVNGLGPRGPETTWHGLAAGPRLTQIAGVGEELFDVSDYPGERWTEPAEGVRLAGQRPARSPCLSLITFCGNEDTLVEVANAEPVMQTFVATAISPIPGKRASVADRVTGPIELETGRLAVADMRMAEAEVDGRASIIAVARAVPSRQVVAEDLGEGIEEGTVTRYLVERGGTIAAGQPLLEIESDGRAVTVPSTENGRLLVHGLRPGDTARPGVPIAVVDVSGQPGAPDPVQVAAVQVPGAIRTPASRYLAVSLALFLFHMALLRRTERAHGTVPQPA